MVVPYQFDQLTEADRPVPDQLGADINPSPETVEKRIFAEIMVMDMAVNDPPGVIRRGLIGVMDKEETGCFAGDLL